MKKIKIYIKSILNEAKLYRRPNVIFGVLLNVFCFVGNVSGQEEKKVIPEGTGADSVKGETKKMPWNEFDFGFTTFKIGGGFLYDFVTYEQDEDGKAQADSAGIVLEPTFKTRDVRLIFSGRFKTKRSFSWKMGVMYDGTNDEWLIRETGIIIGVPELAGHIFIGRQKEGFSLNKVMNGYAGWTMERQMALDVIPILSDGVRWYGFLPKSRIFWNIGIFADWLSKEQSFSTFNWHFATRIGWMPFYNQANNSLLHIAASYRYGEPEDGKIRLRSRPEANSSPYFIDTKEFTSDYSNHFGGEIYYSRGPLMLGSEFYAHSFNSTLANNPIFTGGEVAVSYVLTGESRSYNSTGGNMYGFLPVNKSIFNGGWGAWEILFRVSTLDLTEGTLEGGKLTRFTPMVNWYLSNNIRLDLAYGYGILDRYNLKGRTQFFQSRIQLML